MSNPEHNAALLTSIVELVIQMSKASRVPFGPLTSGAGSEKTNTDNFRVMNVDVPDSNITSTMVVDVRTKDDSGYCDVLLMGMCKGDDGVSIALSDLVNDVPRLGSECKDLLACNHYSQDKIKIVMNTEDWTFKVSHLDYDESVEVLNLIDGLVRYAALLIEPSDIKTVEEAVVQTICYRAPQNLTIH